ncbi:hypothetical protein ES702_00185 [subsurface metagenome]
MCPMLDQSNNKGSKQSPNSSLLCRNSHTLRSSMMISKPTSAPCCIICTLLAIVECSEDPETEITTVHRKQSFRGVTGDCASTFVQSPTPMYRESSSIRGTGEYSVRCKVRRIPLQRYCPSSIQVMPGCLLSLANMKHPRWLRISLPKFPVAVHRSLLRESLATAFRGAHRREP